MKIIHRHNKCYGITLIKCGNELIELWICLKGYTVFKHYHTDFDSNIMLLFGNVFMCAEDKGKTLKSNKLFKWFFIPKFMFHWLEPQDNSFCIFINNERWNKKPSSASANFVSL